MFHESLIYKLIIFISAFLADSWEESLINRGARKANRILRASISGSSIVCFIIRDGYLTTVWEESLAARFLEWLVNLPQLLYPRYKKMEGIFAASLACRLFAAVLEKLHVFLALFLLAALIVPHASWDNLFSTAAAVLLFLLYIARVISTGESRFRKSTISVFLALFMVCVILAQVFSIMPKASLRHLAFYLTCFIFMLLFVLTIRTKKELSSVLNILLAGLTLSGLFGIYQYLTGIAVDPSLTDITLNEVTFGRAYSAFGNPNNFAEILVLLLPFYLSSFINAKGILKKLLYTALFIPPMVSLLLTLSRSGWIGFAVAVIVFVFFVKKWLIPLLIVLAIVVIPFLPVPLYRRILTITNPEDTSIATRFMEYQTVLPVLDNFWFTGLGLGNETFTSVVRNYYIHVKGGKLLAHSHNLFLQIWLETGIIGILSFLAFLISMFKKSMKALWSPGDRQLKYIISAAIAALSGVLVIGLAEHVWFYPRVMLFFWVITGILLCSVRLMRDDETVNSSVKDQECA